MSRKEEIVAKIQEAAIQKFIDNGADRTTMEGIAKAASVSKRTLYKYYPSKDIIFDDIITLHLNTCEESCGVSYSSKTSIREQLEKIVENKVALLTNEEFLKISKLILCEVLKSKPLNKKHFKHVNEVDRKFINWIDQAKKDAKITSKQPTKLIANQFFSIIKGQVYYPVIFRFKEINENDVEIAKTIAIDFFISQFCN